MSDTIRVQVTYTHPDGQQIGRTGQILTLPAWCAGDPEHGAALYLFGYASAAEAFDMVARIEDDQAEPYASEDAEHRDGEDNPY